MTAASAPVRRVLYRDGRDAVVGGVASGLAEHLGIHDARGRWLIRLGFLAMCFGQGIGLVLYATFWIVLPVDADRPVRRGPLRWVIAVIAAITAVVALYQTVTVGRFFIPVAVALLGGALIWRQATETERERWLRLSQTSLRSPFAGRIGLVRLGAGVTMVVAGGVLVLARGGSLSQIRDAFLAVLVVAVGFALITGPLWIRMVSELSAERRERIRAAERDELAAHLHDSVLQTLALIQRNASSPREVARLARGQERELRTLLYGQRPRTGSLATALHSAVGEVEDDYAITVDEVVVGDAPLTEHLDALVQATREALVNAAKHAGVDTVSLYAEVEPDTVEVFVRDRGAGFDLESVPDDRRGVRGSIQDRMDRHGGSAMIRSGAGTGTEVRLTMGRT